jgi:hypothetical protein
MKVIKKIVIAILNAFLIAQPVMALENIEFEVLELFKEDLNKFYNEVNYELQDE